MPLCIAHASSPAGAGVHVESHVTHASPSPLMLPLLLKKETLDLYIDAGGDEDGAEEPSASDFYELAEASCSGHGAISPGDDRPRRKGRGKASPPVLALAHGEGVWHGGGTASDRGGSETHGGRPEMALPASIGAHPRRGAGARWCGLARRCSSNGMTLRTRWGGLTGWRSGS